MLPNISIFKDNKLITYLSLSILFTSFLAFIYSWYMGVNQVISWQILSELGDTKAIIDRFEFGKLVYEIPAKVYFVTEQYMASNMTINITGSYIWLVFYALSITLLLSVATNLKPFAYYISMLLAILSMVSLGFDLQIGSSNYLFTGLILAIIIAISYYFFAFNSGISLIKRFLAFASFFIILGLILYFYAKEPLPFLYLAAQSIPSAFVISCIFIFWISYEIILTILTVSTNGSGQNGLLNFTIGSTIYLINIALTYLHNINQLSWNMLYLNTFLVLLLSIGFGIFNFDKKSESYFKLSNTLSSVYILFLAGSVITLAFAAFAFSTGNDPLIEALEDAIMYTHLAMGACFFLYVFINFLPLFKQKLNVGKVVFRPLQFQLYYFSGAAVLIIFAILMNNQFFPVMQSFSGYYNAIGDHATATNQYTLAEAYYKNALGYERQNHKTNYALASLAKIQGDNRAAGTYFRLAIQKKPTEYAFAALSNSLQKEDLFFEAKFALQDGLKKFPKSGELQNNLALIFEKAKLLDSSYIYLEKAIQNAEKREIPEANLLAYYIKIGRKEKVEQVTNSIAESNYNALNANLLALNLFAENKTKINNFYQFNGDSTLSMPEYAWLNNQVISKANKEGTIDFPFQKLIENESNFNLSNDLLMTHIFSEFYSGNKLTGLELLENLTVNADTSAIGKYNQILFNTLVKNAKEIHKPLKINELNAKQDIENALRTDPLNEDILAKAVEVFNKAKDEKSAYEILITAKHWLPESASIQKLYIFQCFNIHMVPYAKDGMKALKTMNLAEYNSFLPVYQAQMALVEKANEGFN